MQSINERNEAARRMYQKGEGYVEIAVKLHISPNTVRMICRNIVRDPKPTDNQCRQCGEACGTQELCRKCHDYVQVGPAIEKPCEPTKHLPGSPEKVQVLRERLGRGEQLHHPGDASDFTGATGIIPRAVATLGEKLSKMQSCPVATEFVRFVKAVSQ